MSENNHAFIATPNELWEKLLCEVCDGLTMEEVLGHAPLRKLGQVEGGFLIGGFYFIRTVIYHHVGRVVHADLGGVWLAPNYYVRNVSEWGDLARGHANDAHITPKELWPVEVKQPVIQDVSLWKWGGIVPA